jgi:hypothetical protein
MSLIGEHSKMLDFAGNSRQIKLDYENILVSTILDM